MLVGSISQIYVPQYFNINFNMGNFKFKFSTRYICNICRYTYIFDTNIDWVLHFPDHTV